MRREKNIQDITDAEWYVMQALWNGADQYDEQGMTLGQVAEQLELQPQVRLWSKPTVRTLLIRLEEKKAITVDRSRGVYRYVPTFTRDEHLQDQVQMFVNRVFDGSVEELLKILREMGIEK